MMDGNVNTASMGEMNDQAGLEALVADLGSGNVIDAELLEGCSVEAHELDEMGPEEAPRSLPTVLPPCLARPWSPLKAARPMRMQAAGPERWTALGS
jgi:hypothetical protein